MERAKAAIQYYSRLMIFWIKNLPEYDDWRPAMNSVNLCKLSRYLKEEEREYFEQLVTIGCDPPPISLKDLGVTHKDFPDPRKAAKKTAEDPIEQLATLEVYCKMLTTKSICKNRKSWSASKEDDLNAPKFVLYQKGKPRIIKNHSSQITRTLHPTLPKWVEWMRDPINKATWKRLKGMPSRNTFISKRDATLGYPSNRDLMTWRAYSYREMLAIIENRVPNADEITGSTTADMLSWYFQVITGEDGETHFIATPRISGFQQKQIDFSHRTTSMGKREACRDGDFLTSKLRDIVAARLEEKKGVLSLTWAANEVVPPSAYGLVDVISKEDIEKLRRQQEKGLKNPKSFVHRTHEIFIRYRSGSSCPKSMSWMDDVAVIDRMKHCGLVMTEMYDFYAENNILLSTVNGGPIPSNDPINRLNFLGFEFFGDQVSFTKTKWKSSTMKS